MNYKVIPVEKFKKEAKRLLKKYPSLRLELADLEKELSANPVTGTQLGKNTYKVRVGIESKGRGKSGGARVITYIVTENKEIFLLTIYDKGDFDTIEDKTIKKIIENIKNRS